jgi:hypothetical protein
MTPNLTDESENPTLHRFLSFCRLLMNKHPRFGAHEYDLALGNVPYELGWYALHRSADQSPEEPDIMYMQISEQGGRLTPKKPDCDPDDIHHVFEDKLPQLQGSNAWRQTEALGDLLGKQAHPVWSRERITSVLENIERAGVSVPLRSDDGTIAGLVQRAMERMNSVANSSGDTVAVLEFLRPILDLLKMYLRFELTGTQAANVLCRIMLYCCVNIPSPLTERSPIERVFESTRYLIKRTYGLLKERNNLKLTPFYDATYLALLYGETAILNYKTLLRYSETLDAADRKTIERESFAVDEKVAHEACPSLMHPMLLVPFGIIESMVTARFGVDDRTGLYPGVPQRASKQVDFEATLEAIQEYSSHADNVVIIETLEHENSPISEELKQHILGFLLAIALGRRMP